MSAGQPDIALHQIPAVPSRATFLSWIILSAGEKVLGSRHPCVQKPALATHRWSSFPVESDRHEIFLADYPEVSSTLIRAFRLLRPLIFHPQNVAV